MMNILSPDRRPLGIRIALWTPSRARSPDIRSASFAVACAHRRLVAVTEASLDVMALSTSTWLASPRQLPPARGMAETHLFEPNPTGMSS
jgi:hypothetical protein